jgi:hypothetical protein
MKTLRILAGLCLVSISVGCGGGADTSSTGAAGSTAGPASSSASAKAVPHEKLAELLPAMPGWKRETEPKGDTDPSSNVSRVQVSYVEDGTSGAGISVEMMDVASNAEMIAPLRELLKISGTRTGPGGTTQKVINIAGHVATEEWTPEANNGNVSVLVGDRFVVTVTGSTVANVGVIHKVVEAIDLKKVAAVK